MLSWWKCSTALCQVDPFLFTASTESGYCQRSDWEWLTFEKPAFKETCAWIQIASSGSDMHNYSQNRAFTQRNLHFNNQLSHTQGPVGVQAAPPPLLIQVKRSTQNSHMAQLLAFLPILPCICGVHESLRQPPLHSLWHARLLVAEAESRACQEPCLGATWNDKMWMRAKDWHMVLISSQVYRGSPSTEHNQAYTQHPAHRTSSRTHRFPEDATETPYFKIRSSLFVPQQLDSLF